MSTSRPVLLSISATVVAGLAATLWALPRVGLVAALWAFVAVLLAESFPTRIRWDAHVSLANVVVLGAVLVGGAPLAVIAVWGALLPCAWRPTAPPRALKVAFNVHQMILSALAAGLVYEGLVAWWSVTFPHGLSLLAIGVAAIVYTLVNHLLVGGAVALSNRESLRSAIATLGPAALLEIPYVGIAVLGVVVLELISPWALALMALPVLVARYALLAFQRLDESYDRLVRGFVKAIEVKDLYTRGHSERVAELSAATAEDLGVPYDERRLIRYAALLHDVGKIGVPLCVLNKPGALDDEEFEQIKQHPAIGVEILGDIDFLAPVLDVVGHHHERLDGRGYPDGLGEAELSRLVRIVTAADAFDAMTSTRSYRRAFSVDEALAELRRCSHTQFDAEVVEAVAITVEQLGWEPTEEFASAPELGDDADAIPTGSLTDRVSRGED